MQSTIKEILQKIETLQGELKERYDELSKEYGYAFEKRKIQFQEAIRKRNREFRIPAWRYFIPKSIRHILSIPFIYGMIVPAVILDICITIYQWGAFSLYHIPKVRRSDYIVYDRKYLDYLNWVEKINCLYCSYVNGLFAYAVEIGARTERYWCPIKSASNPRFSHTWYKDFADYGNPEEWKRKYSDDERAFTSEKCFHK